MSVNISLLATQHPHRATDMTPRRPWGLLLHTTGGGIPAKAKATGRDAVAVALAWYRRSQDGANGYFWGGPTYVLGHAGDLHQIAPDDVMTMHCGGPDRAAYLNGSWEVRVSSATVTRWRRQWPDYRSPYHLFPSKTPNADYIGVEMIPCGAGLGKPMRPGLRFTQAQHDACVSLARDVAQRHGLPAGWQHTPRLLGHEDVQPIERHDKHGGWDPGHLRVDPFFDFEYVRSRI
jgi:hypothetical protein